MQYHNTGLPSIIMKIKEATPSDTATGTPITNSANKIRNMKRIDIKILSLQSGTI
jgi:hypothetical protein